MRLPIPSRSACQRPAPGWRCSRPPEHPDACLVHPGPLARLRHALHLTATSPAPAADPEPQPSRRGLYDTMLGDWSTP